MYHMATIAFQILSVHSFLKKCKRREVAKGVGLIVPTKEELGLVDSAKCHGGCIFCNPTSSAFVDHQEVRMKMSVKCNRHSSMFSPK